MEKGLAAPGECIIGADSHTCTYGALGEMCIRDSSNAIRENLGIRFTNLTYQEHALEEGSSSQAVAYVSITGSDGKVFWGVGIQDDIIYASVKALFSAVNRMIR